MNVIDALKRIPRCWEISTNGEKFNLNNLISVEVSPYGTIYFKMRYPELYRICRDSYFVEEYHVGKGWRRI